jgi:type IX secretion system PorP/SprF family membrane protein
MNIRLHIIAFIAILTTGSAKAQDPAFSQFFSSPLNVNPALTGNINGDWRVISNLRDQWVGPASPYRTGTISFDTKILQRKIPENSSIGIGGMMMLDQAMEGAIKSSYASLNTSYSIQLGADAGDHRLGMGIGLIYGNRRVDYTKLNFEEQFTGYGFDTNLPTGEAALSQMKGYVSTSMGLLYSFTSTYSNFDAGVSAFHLNKPKRTVLEDPKQSLAPRYVAHMNFETFLNDYLVLNTNAVYQNQAGTSYYQAGAAIGYFLSTEGEENVILNAGMWYWSKNAVIPYVGMVYKNFQVGVSYDVTVSKLSEASIKPKTFEIALIIRGATEKEFIPCPWK